MYTYFVAVQLDNIDMLSSIKGVKEILHAVCDHDQSLSQEKISNQSVDTGMHSQELW